MKKVILFISAFILTACSSVQIKEQLNEEETFKKFDIICKEQSNKNFPPKIDKIRAYDGSFIEVDENNNSRVFYYLKCMNSNGIPLRMIDG
jgi:hypothetical protein